MCYKNIVNPQDLSHLTPRNREVSEQIIALEKQGEKTTYTLNFTTDESYFFATPGLTTNNLQEYALTIDGKLKYYANKKTGENRELMDGDSGKMLVKNNAPLYRWTLTNETKMIQNFKCFKAISPVFTDGQENKNAALQITAWYCPEIPSKFGPVGFGDLPGLILELNKPISSFIATSISLQKETPFIDRLDKEEAMEVQEYWKKIMNNIPLDKLKSLETK